MKKEIIISDEDFKELERLAKLGKQKEKRLVLEFYMTENKCGYKRLQWSYSQEHFYNLPNSLKPILIDALNSFKEQVDSFNTKLEKSVNCEIKLKKIPKWVRRLYLGKQDC